MFRVTLSLGTEELNCICVVTDFMYKFMNIVALVEKG